MSGTLLGLCLGLGLLLIWRSGPRRPAPRQRSGRTVTERTQELLTQAGYDGLTPAQLYGACAAAGVVALVVAAGTSRSAPIALAFAGFAGYAPLALVRMRRRQRTTELRDLWPDAVDNLASAVRAGLSLPEALAQLAVRGPEPLRPAFARFGEDYRATGRFGECLDRLKLSLADPVGDRIVESLRLARDVGGTDLGRLLRTLSQFLRDDARTRAELETRQGWTVNAARLGLAAPWVMLGLMSLRPETVAAYNTPAGALVIAGGAGISLLAYRVMLRIARLPVERRVLR
ncbi:MAG TPA: type II secretion system F family protein [Mycobacteriales bacterium]|jgi:tight adherence protein B|nr:type II secretion system F family protein [Mycobacteriales bacterium]